MRRRGPRRQRDATLVAARGGVEIEHRVLQSSDRRVHDRRARHGRTARRRLVRPQRGRLIGVILGQPSQTPVRQARVREPAHRVEQAGARRRPIAGCHQRVGFRDAGAFVGWIERRRARGGRDQRIGGRRRAEARQRLGISGLREQTKAGDVGRRHEERRVDRRVVEQIDRHAGEVVGRVGGRPALTAVEQRLQWPRLAPPLRAASRVALRYRYAARARCRLQLSRGRIRRRSRRGPVEPRVARGRAAGGRPRRTGRARRA